MKYFITLLVIATLGTLGWYSYSSNQNNKETIRLLNQELVNTNEEIQELSTIKQQLEQLKTDLKNNEDTHTILVAGDIMLDRGVEAKILSLGEDYHFPFDLVREQLELADIAFANLEGPMSDLGADTGKKYSFRFDPQGAEGLAGAGIDIVSLANNHMLDWGREALCDTKKHLTESGIAFVGGGCNTEEAEAPYITELGNTRVAFLAYTEFYKGAHATENRAGMSEFNMTKIKERITTLKDQQEVDVVLVSMHWGEEYKSRATLAQVEIGQALIDMGADVIIGHHPHVDQEIERYGDGWIIYSLGNFVFDQSWSQETMEGLIVEIQIQNKRVYDLVPKVIELNNNFQPFFSHI